MKQYFFPVVIAVAVAIASCSPGNRRADEKAIRDVLSRQEVAWNMGNIEAFMEGYWKSDSLMFIGEPITYGWKATLERYHRSYPDRDAMGTLKFTFNRFKFISPDACLVTGRYQLTRTSDAPAGMFTLLIRKIDGQWRIVYDHTS